jgi:hypothetical protein
MEQTDEHNDGNCERFTHDLVTEDKLHFLKVREEEFTIRMEIKYMDHSTNDRRGWSSRRI